MLGIEEQSSLQAHYRSKLLPEGSFQKEMDVLNQYITQNGPVMPMLVKGESGSGVSSLLANWLASIEDSLPNSCILYHVADTHSAYSIDPVHILRRFLILLLDQLPMFFSVKELEKEFPRWLDRACSKHQNGVIIIVDGIDLINNYKDYFKWFLDPLPVPVRVIVSVTGGSKNHPKQWSEWFPLTLQCDLDQTVSLCQLQIQDIPGGVNSACNLLLQRILQDGRVLPLLSNHLYRNLIFAVFKLMMSDGEIHTISPRLLNCKSLTDIYVLLLVILDSRHDKKLMRLVLCSVYFTENGLTVAELMEVCGEDPGLLMLLYDLEMCELVADIDGLLKISHKLVSFLFNDIYGEILFQ
jgi:hypothetical protein